MFDKVTLFGCSTKIYDKKCFDLLKDFVIVKIIFSLAHIPLNGFIFYQDD